MTELSHTNCNDPVSTQPGVDGPLSNSNCSQNADLRPPPKAHIRDQSACHKIGVKDRAKDRERQRLGDESTNGMLKANGKQYESRIELQHKDSVGRNAAANTKSKKQKKEEEEPVEECHFVFLCYQHGYKQYTVVVKIFWPDESVTGKEDAKAGFGEQIAEIRVLQAMQDALYQQIGNWKRGLPCYEIRSAYEVNFSFDDIVERDRGPVRIYLLPVDNILEEARATLANEPSYFECSEGSARPGEPWHEDHCLDSQEMGGACIQERLSDATDRFRGYHRQHWLTECLQNPKRAQTRKFLESGLLQKSFVYQTVVVPTNAEQLYGSGEIRGVFVTMGWNFTRILHNVRVGSVYTFLGLAIIWLGCIIWAGHRGDWSTAWAFGQVLAASVALVLHHT